MRVGMNASKTGRYSFKDSSGVEWFIRGPSKNCPGYTDCWTADGKAVTVRQTDLLLAAGMAIPREGTPLVRQEQEETDEQWTDAEILAEYCADYTDEEVATLAEYL